MSELQVPGYTLGRVIGRGGFGVVYTAHDRAFGRDVAIKFLTGAYDDAAAARFERECRAAGALSGHPNIVVVHGSGIAEGDQPYLIMELLSGGSLAQRLANDGPLPWQEVAQLGIRLAGALDTAHQAGVLHRDVKPENVLFSSYGEPKLVDFGIATLRGGYETKSAGVSASLGHAAPEIISGQRATVASDVYSLGSTLFQALSGHPAFVDEQDETFFPLIARISTAPVPDLRPLGVPDELAATVEACMAKALQDRPETAGDVADQLRALLAVPQVPEPDPAGTVRRPVPAPLAPAPKQPVRSRRLVPLVLASAAVLVAAGTGWALSAQGTAGGKARALPGASPSGIVVRPVDSTPTSHPRGSASPTGKASASASPIVTPAVAAPSHTSAPHPLVRVSSSPASSHASTPRRTTVPVTKKSATTSPAPQPNRPPVTKDNSYTIPVCTHGWYLEVLSDDSDPDGDALSLAITNAPPPGLDVSVTTYNGREAFLMNASQDYCDNHRGVGVDFSVSDNHGHSVPETVNLSFAP